VKVLKWKYYLRLSLPCRNFRLKNCSPLSFRHRNLDFSYLPTQDSHKPSFLYVLISAWHRAGQRRNTKGSFRITKWWKQSVSSDSRKHFIDSVLLRRWSWYGPFWNQNPRIFLFSFFGDLQQNNQVGSQDYHSHAWNGGLSLSHPRPTATLVTLHVNWELNSCLSLFHYWLSLPGSCRVNTFRKWYYGVRARGKTISHLWLRYKGNEILLVLVLWEKVDVTLISTAGAGASPSCFSAEPNELLRGEPGEENNPESEEADKKQRRGDMDGFEVIKSDDF